ncbi:hypothetical protein IU418_06170 [Nocardia farcinica]|nr:hypothetical protein [Nocardia farcinica]
MAEAVNGKGDQHGVEQAEINAGADGLYEPMRPLHRASRSRSRSCTVVPPSPGKVGFEVFGMFHREFATVCCDRL